MDSQTMTESSAKTEGGCCRVRRSLDRAGGLLLLLGVLFFVAGGNPAADSRGPSRPTFPAMPVAPAAEDADAAHRELALGTWEDDYKGKRTMHLHADGTGTMIVELTGWSARLFAERLDFDMVWSVREGRMQKQTLGGRPEGKVKAILKMMGDRVDEPILELTEERLRLLDADGTTEYDWRRVAKAEPDS